MADEHLVEIDGTVDPKLESVAECFLEGFSLGRDVGAAVAAVVGGELVVDIWHGFTDRRQTEPWEEDTLVCMFSVTKAMTATCVLQAVDRGLLALDAPAADYWPEFAAAGKAGITVRQLLSHRAGLIGFHEPVSRDIYYHWGDMVTALAAEEPWWEPGANHGYHARTFGYLLGELLRRVSGRTVGEWFKREIAEPLDLDFWIGVPESQISRCAQMLPARVLAGAVDERPEPVRRMMADFYDVSTPTGAAFQNPSLGPGYMNTEAFRRAEMPALNGHGTARAVATLYANLHRLVSKSLLDEATRTWSVGPDMVLKSVTRFGLGFQLHHEQAPIGVREGSFGHAGAGGSLAFYDPERDVAFCFAMNQMQEGVVTGGTSATNIVRSIYECL